MAELLHQIDIAAPPERVYAALATRAGLAGWWSGEVALEPRVGGLAVLGFARTADANVRSISGRAPIIATVPRFRMRIDELVPPVAVAWTCVGDEEEWTGTRLAWEIEALEPLTRLRLAHAGWRSTSGWYAACNTTWGMLMHRLRDWCEAGEATRRSSGKG